jgi:hypothetical protein
MHCPQTPPLPRRAARARVQAAPRRPGRAKQKAPGRGRATAAKREGGGALTHVPPPTPAARSSKGKGSDEIARRAPYAPRSAVGRILPVADCRLEMSWAPSRGLTLCLLRGLRGY